MLKRLLLVLVLIVASSPAANAAPSTDEAVAASKTWLGLIVSGDYAGSWKSAAAFFQQGALGKDGQVDPRRPRADAVPRL